MANLLFVEVVTCVVLSLNDDGRLQALILKRSNDEVEGPGLWTIPGGKVEKQDFGPEIPTQNTPVFEGVLDRAIIREVYDEIGVTLSADEIVTLRGKALVFIRKDGTPTMVHRYFVFLKKVPEVVLGHEATEYAWATRNDLHWYAFLGNVGENIVDVMKECAQKYKRVKI